MGHAIDLLASLLFASLLNVLSLTVFFSPSPRCLSVRSCPVCSPSTRGAVKASRCLYQASCDNTAKHSLLVVVVVVE